MLDEDGAGMGLVMSLPPLRLFVGSFVVTCLVAAGFALLAPAAHTQQEPPPPEIEADEEADWQALGAARRAYLRETNDENLAALLAAARHYLDGAPEPGTRTEIALGLGLQALERFERWQEMLEWCKRWQPSFDEEASFRIALLVYRAKAHAHLGHVEEAKDLVLSLRGTPIDEDEVALFVRQAVHEVERILKLRPGQEPPAFALPPLEEEEPREVESAQLLEREEHVLLLFWASWCGKCRLLIEEELVPLAQRLEERPFRLVSIGLNWRDSSGAQRDAVKEVGATWLHLYDETAEVAETYGVRHVPFLVLVDADGQIVHAGTAWGVIDRVSETLEAALLEESEESEQGHGGEAEEGESDEADTEE